jgi:hypothetical protein
MTVSHMFGPLLKVFLSQPSPLVAIGRLGRLEAKSEQSRQDLSPRTRIPSRCSHKSNSDPTRYYTGIDGNVRRRLAEHNAGGCRHTSRWNPWRVLVVVAFASETRALHFERYLKSGSGCAFAARHFR